jgi:hypothetical protein
MFSYFGKNKNEECGNISIQSQNNTTFAEYTCSKNFRQIIEIANFNEFNFDHSKLFIELNKNGRKILTLRFSNREDLMDTIEKIEFQLKRNKCAKECYISSQKVNELINKIKKTMLTKMFDP